MGYIPTTWQDRNVATPRDFVATKGGGGAISSGDTLTMTPNPGTITATGVAPNKSRMDNIDEGVESLYNGDGLYVVTTGSANTYVADFTPDYTTYTTGLTLRVKFNLENTTTSTINVDTLGAKTIKKVTGAGIEVLEAGDIVADGVYIIVYDGVEDAFIVSNQFKVKPMNQVFTANGTFTAPFTGNYKVTVCGGGASGSSTGTASNTRGGGGGTGGTCIEIVTLSKSDAVTVTIGSGGAQQTTTDSDGVNGNNGGASSFGAYCTANGGSGGVSGSSFGIGGAGGTGTGGDVNITGAKGNFTFESNGLNCNNNVKQPHILFGESYGYGGGGGTGTGDFGDAGADGIVIVDWMEG